jgi:hypothetical protein
MFSRAWRVVAATLVAGLAAACGDDPAPTLRVEVGEVTRACTTDVHARDPFGSGRGVDRYAMKIEVGPEVRSFVLAGHHPSGSTTLASLRSPSDLTYDLILDDELARFHPAATATIYGFPTDIDRIMIPPEPSRTSMLEVGTWEVLADTTADKLCLSAVASGEPGTDLDLVVYVVGVSAFDAASAPAAPHWNTTLDVVAAVLAQSGIRLDVDDIHYFDADLMTEARFALLRSADDFYELVATSERPPRSVGDLRLNVFLIRGFGGELGGGLLGIASGVPGVAGVHGTEDSGIVFGVDDYLEVEDVGEGVSGAEYVGYVMAHEIGHFLGLFHTTELFGGIDPLPDTPMCPGLGTLQSVAQMREVCPDVDNLMFPLALPGQIGTLTAGQEATMKLNPLVRPQGARP